MGLEWRLLVHGWDRTELHHGVRSPLRFRQRRFDAQREPGGCSFLAGEELGMDVVQRHIHRSELYLAEEVFLTGTAAHVIAVGELDHRAISTG